MRVLRYQVMLVVGTMPSTLYSVESVNFQTSTKRSIPN